MFLDCALLGRDSKIDAAVARLNQLTNSELLMTSTETLVQVTRSEKVLGHIETSNTEIRKVVQNIEDEMRSTQSERISKGTPHIAALILAMHPHGGKAE